MILNRPISHCSLAKRARIALRPRCTAPLGLVQITMRQGALIRGGLELCRLIPGAWSAVMLDIARIGRVLGGATWGALGDG